VADIGVVVGVIGKIKPRISNYTSKNRMLAPEMAECRLLGAKRWLTGGRHFPYFSLQYHNRMIGSALAKLEGSETIQGAADDRSGGIVAATVIIISISIVPVATTAISVTTAAVAASARKMTSAVTTTGVPSYRMSTHRVTAHGMTTRGVPSAVTSTMSSRKGTSYRHATKGDCGSENN
jgi:hypothetical protein